MKHVRESFQPSARLVAHPVGVSSMLVIPQVSPPTTPQIVFPMAHQCSVVRVVVVRFS
jgi:hypothetical protein